MNKKLILTLKVASVTALIAFLFLFSACALTFPPDWEDYDYQPIRIILKINPDDAQVIFNGKWIGDAYEFSTYKTAIKLNSRNNELIIKREGYIEEVIDLNRYRSDDVTIRLDLRRDLDYRESTKSEQKPIPKTKPVERKNTEVYQPKTETPPPTVPQEESSVIDAKIVELSLHVLPEESSIYLNGKFLGISPEGGKIENLRLKQGKYSIEVVKPGYKTYKKEWEFKNPKATLTISLEKE
jgi:hypothetical protein